MFAAMTDARRRLAAALLALAVCGCSDPPQLRLVVATFNTGTTAGLPHDDPPDDGYTSADAAISDMYYGDGLAWPPAIDAAHDFFAEVAPDLVNFQEIFYAGDCATIPAEARTGFVCETWQDGDPTVVQMVLGDGYQVACNLGKPDKCAAVKRSVGSFRGCDRDLCLDGLDGGVLDGCGGGSRVGRGVVDLVAGGSITLVNLHGTSGLTAADQQCRVREFDQVFVDLGDGSPAASGAANLIMGDLNTDPGRFASADDSAARFAELVDGAPFHFVTDVGEAAPATYAGAVNIDHVVSDRFDGDCWYAGVTDGHPPVTAAVYFDHQPVVCTVAGDLP